MNCLWRINSHEMIKALYNITKTFVRPSHGMTCQDSYLNSYPNVNNIQTYYVYPKMSHINKI